jgi:hypothetical protein
MATPDPHDNPYSHRRAFFLPGDDPLKPSMQKPARQKDANHKKKTKIGIFLA